MLLLVVQIASVEMAVVLCVEVCCNVLLRSVILKIVLHVVNVFPHVINIADAHLMLIFVKL